MNSCELVVYISSVACAIAKSHSRDDVALLAVAFSQLGDTLATILAHNEICCQAKNKEEDEPEPSCSDSPEAI